MQTTANTLCLPDLGKEPWEYAPIDRRSFRRWLAYFQPERAAVRLEGGYALYALVATGHGLERHRVERTRAVMAALYARVQREVEARGWTLEWEPDEVAWFDLEDEDEHIHYCPAARFVKWYTGHKRMYGVGPSFAAEPRHVEWHSGPYDAHETWVATLKAADGTVLASLGGITDPWDGPDPHRYEDCVCVELALDVLRSTPAEARL